MRKMHTPKVPPKAAEPEVETLSFPDNDESSPEPPPSPKPHARVYHVGTMRVPVRSAPLRDSPRGKLVAKYKEILGRGKKKAGSASVEVDEHEPPRRPAGSRPARPALPMGFPRFRHEVPEPFEDDDEDD
jgi:hypothetical protein